MGKNGFFTSFDFLVQNTWFTRLFTFCSEIQRGFFVLVTLPSEKRILFIYGQADVFSAKGLPVRIFETHSHKTKKFFVLCDFGSGYKVMARNATIFWIDKFLEEN